MILFDQLCNMLCDIKSITWRFAKVLFPGIQCLTWHREGQKVIVSFFITNCNLASKVFLFCQVFLLARSRVLVPDTAE